MTHPWKAVQLVAIVVALLTSARSSAQQTEDIQPGRAYVAFRMEDWQTKHIHDAAQAKQHVATLKKLGCEVKTSAHQGHTDVQCRTFFWKSLVVNSADQAKKWIDWLHAAGFETIHGYPVGTGPTAKPGQREAVQYRLTEWQTRHIHDTKELNQLLALYRGLGVEVEVGQHNGHSDVKARCPEWMEIRLPSHSVATAWERFLEEAGFETKHVH